MYKVSNLLKSLKKAGWTHVYSRLQDGVCPTQAKVSKAKKRLPEDPGLTDVLRQRKRLKSSKPLGCKMMSQGSTGPTVIIATPDALRYATPEEVITALTRPPMDIQGDEYKDYIENVLGIAGELYKLLENDVEILRFKTKKNDERCEELSLERKRIDADHTNIMHILDEISIGKSPTAFSCAKELEESIRGRYKFCHRALQDIHEELGDLNKWNTEAISRKDAISQVFYWAKEQQAELAKMEQTKLVTDA